ncbi:unnamed protein product [Thelazia callipaeda]|uniref:40S ribosomal protein S25 n=1 Tax=Thelazia callipaeda TaxID=103827 RepID=A0A0N5CK20_THECL|nr:unnamed protein product [Thelazia callipaeda]
MTDIASQLLVAQPCYKVMTSERRSHRVGKRRKEDHEVHDNFPLKPNLGRPITYMSDLHKLTTKHVVRVMQLDVAMKKLLANDQLGTVTKVKGTKEQALMNLAVCREQGNRP